MLQNLNIIHRRKPYVFGELSTPVWSTCLRSLAFGSDAKADAHAEDEIFSCEAAYRFLLEVICGLHSPILGETEVFGQFKTFAAAWVKDQPERAGLVQRLLSDAKAIRATHLAGLGNQSYGSWVRKKLRAQNVHILGAGQLAHEILPFVSKAAKSVSLHVRDTARAQGAPAFSLQSQAFTHGALILAAPVSAAFVLEWLGDKKPSQVFDLRDTSAADPLLVSCKQFRLGDIFAQIEDTKKRLEPVIEKVRAEIHLCSERFSLQAIIRPQGWDDLCA